LDTLERAWRSAARFPQYDVENTDDLPTYSPFGRSLVHRIRPDLRKSLERAAKASGRSLSQEVEHRLRRSFVEDDKIADAFGDRRTYRLMRHPKTRRAIVGIEIRCGRRRQGQPQDPLFQLQRHQARRPGRVGQAGGRRRRRHPARPQQDHGWRVSARLDRRVSWSVRQDLGTLPAVDRLADHSAPRCHRASKTETGPYCRFAQKADRRWRRGRSAVICADGRSCA
jgi:hypothetical protein